MAADAAQYAVAYGMDGASFEKQMAQYNATQQPSTSGGVGTGAVNMHHPNLYVRNIPATIDMTGVELMFRRFGVVTGCKYFRNSAVSASSTVACTARSKRTPRSTFLRVFASPEAACSLGEVLVCAGAGALRLRANVHV
jgi:hypothetical protein